MKKRSLKRFQIKTYSAVKDNEGNVIESYSNEANEDVALIWPASSKLQVELYGMRVNGILNMHYYGSLEIKEHDMINYEGVAYKVVSIQKLKRFKAIGIEKI